MNRLQHETSPYLLQHATNPVDWYAWKPEAFERAREENKPILVSIGYSTCHWCHVMERESFEDEQVAAYMNQHFINIKVDREERPDVDQIYMEVCQAMTGSGGWPLNCFLLPDGRPFHAGTYYPPRPVHNRPSWVQLLRGIVDAYENKHTAVKQQADRLTQAVAGADDVFIGDVLADEKEELFTPQRLETIFANLEKNFDKEEGGIGGAPKFPATMSLKYLLDHYYYTGKEEALDHVELSLDKMIRGGIYDQLGGGFARYATDRAWLIPHFEKMLYDNALLVSLLADAYRLTRKPLYRQAIEETLTFIQREMTSPEGGFYSALDADSEGEEGKFYVWNKKEVDTVLGEKSELFCQFYNVIADGNWEGNNILWRPQPLEEFAANKGINPEKLSSELAESRRRLFLERSKRIRPGLDDKILLGWNAMQCCAYAKACAALKNEDYGRAARKNLDFLLNELKKDGTDAFYHTYKEGKAQYDAFLDDYALLISALLDVYEITFDSDLLDRADRYTTFVLENFLDHNTNLFYFTSENQQDLIMRRKDMYDSATPSGNSTMVQNLQKLGILLDRDDYRELAVQMLSRVVEAVTKYPSSFSRWAGAVAHTVHAPDEIAVVGPDAIPTALKINTQFIPNRVMMASAGDSPFPLLAGKGGGDDTNIYVCKDYACKLPVKTIEEMRRLVQPEHLLEKG